MQIFYKKLVSLLQKSQIKKTLDIGAGKGYASLLAASYGSRVDAIKPNLMPHFQFPDILKITPLSTLLPKIITLLNEDAYFICSYLDDKETTQAQKSYYTTADFSSLNCKIIFDKKTTIKENHPP